MRMNIKTIVALVLLVLSGAMATFLYVRIKEKNDQKIMIVDNEAKVINKLMAIRRAENAYFSVNNKFTSNWDTLKLFINEGKFYLTERKESIIQREYGGDSIFVQIDTLASVGVKDSIFSKDYADFDISSMDKLPHSDTTFSIYTSMFEEGAVIEVKDSDPVNPERQKDGRLQPLKFGSQNAPTTKGNWEK